MTGYAPKDPAYADRVRMSFAKQAMMTTIGASLTRVAPGEVEIDVAISPSICQQHGFVYAGAVATAADSAAGYAALSLMPPGAGVLTAEFKINLVAPAAGERGRGGGGEGLRVGVGLQLLDKVLVERAGHVDHSLGLGCGQIDLEVFG